MALSRRAGRRFPAPRRRTRSPWRRMGTSTLSAPRPPAPWLRRLGAPEQRARIRGPSRPARGSLGEAAGLRSGEARGGATRPPCHGACESRSPDGTSVVAAAPMHELYFGWVWRPTLPSAPTWAEAARGRPSFWPDLAAWCSNLHPRRRHHFSVAGAMRGRWAASQGRGHRRHAGANPARRRGRSLGLRR